MATRPDVDDIDPYRYTCPHGHASFEPVDGHFWCRRCARSENYPGDGHHDTVIDQRTGDELDREDVRDIIPAPRTRP